MAYIRLPLLLIVLLAGSAFGDEKGVDVSERLARWDINYAVYLVDVGKYLDALETFNAAIDAARLPETAGKALLHKANLLAIFLDAPDNAENVYRTIISDYPAYVEPAMYRLGLILYVQGRYKDASTVLRDYLKRYPTGRHRYSAEVILSKVIREIPPPPKFAKTGAMPLVRVLLERGAAAVTLRARSGMLSVKGLDIRDTTLTFNMQGDSLRLGGIALSRRIIIRQGSIVNVSAGRTKKNVRGDIELIADGSGIMVINVVEMESYLRSVVPSESYSRWDADALMAQAIAARSYALYQVIHRRDWPYDLVDDEGDQVYLGSDRESVSTNKAVAETEGVIASSDGKPILAMYTSNNGGYSAESLSIFQIFKPYLSAQPDSYSLKGDRSFWRTRLTSAEIERGLRSVGLVINGLNDIQPYETDKSGRVVKIRISAMIGSGIYLTRPTLRKGLNLPEILFIINHTGDWYEFSGRGYGHGVGYSQWGGAIMAREGVDYKSIIGFYYPGAELIKVW